MTTKTKKDDIRFIVDVSTARWDRDYLMASAYPVILEDGKIRNCQWNGLRDRGAEYADLKITGQFHRESTDDSFFCGYSPLQFAEVYSIDLPRAESMTKTLRRLEKKIEDLTKTYGHPQDFAAYLGYLSAAIGRGTYDASFARCTARGDSYDNSSYIWMGVNDLRYYFQSEIRKFKGE